MASPKPMLHVGVDIGSTTVKIVALPDIAVPGSPEAHTLFYSKYRKHYADIKASVAEMLSEACDALKVLICTA